VHGRKSALAVYRELDAALQTTRALISDEGIDCCIARCGRFVGANSVAHYDRMAKELEITRRHLGFDFHMVPKSEQCSWIASDRYEGEAAIHDLGSRTCGHSPSPRCIPGRERVGRHPGSPSSRSPLARMALSSFRADRFRLTKRYGPP